MKAAQDIRALAARHGIAPDYIDARGATVDVDGDVLRKLLESMGVGEGRGSSAPSRLPPCLVVTARGGQVAVPFATADTGEVVHWRLTLEDGGVRSGESAIQPVDGRPALLLADVPTGYHRLATEAADHTTSLIVTPGQCWLPDHFATGEKSWGVSLQLYLLRSRRNWGIGDFSDLAQLAGQLGALGCDVLGLNPLHQMFLDEPEQASPYSPSDRQFLNVLNIDVESIAEYAQSDEAQALVASPDFREALQACRAADKVDYSAAAALKLAALRLVHATFLDKAAAERVADYRAFVAEAGQPLHRASLFQALRWHFDREHGHSAAPQNWPEGLRSATAPDVEHFASQQQREIDFLDWLQWIADRQLGAASSEAAAAGMRIGLYRDLAVGCDRGGGELWSDPDAFLKGVLVGAPPDILNPAGQNWGLPPFNPVALTEQGYAPFIRLIRANMRYAGGVRIDHVMGLQRLYCIPDGLAGGAYVSYPIDDLVGILALESHRHRCLVVGEDLGTVPEGFRERMADANILSYRVTFFEQAEGGSYIPPDQYPAIAVAVAGSHDLPTLHSWLSGSDIDLRHSLGLYPSNGETELQQKYRADQKSEFLKALQLPEPVQGRAFADAVHDFLARTNSLLAVTQLDDLLDEVDPVNVPGTSTEHPNWRRKYAVELEELHGHGSVRQGLASLTAGRGPGATRARSETRDSEAPGSGTTSP